MKKALTVIGIVLHVVSCVLLVLYNTAPAFVVEFLIFSIFALILSFIAYYAEAAWSFNDCANAFNILKLVYVLISVVFAIAFLAVLFAARDGLEIFDCSFAVYYLLLLVLEVISLLKKKECTK